jgi:hypothetical protein
VKIMSVEKFGREHLLAKLAETRLMGFDGAQPYANAKITLETLDTDDLVPAQRYVLSPIAAKITELRAALLPLGHDIFAPDGGLIVRTDEQDEDIPVIPPVVEESREPDGRTVLLINDGIHRVWAARTAGLPIQVAVVRGVPEEYPYYAFALPGGWADVVEFDELPDNFQKKEYRVPDQYRLLFRDFNRLFPGVQKVRRHSNPDHLRP